MKQLTPQERENYLNLSRWIDHLQNTAEVRQNADLINFATIHLLGWNTRA